MNRREFLRLVAVTFGALCAPFDLNKPNDYANLARPIKRQQTAISIMAPGAYARRYGETYTAGQKFEDVTGRRVQGLSFFPDIDQNPPMFSTIDNTLRSERVVMLNLKPQPTDTRGINRRSYYRMLIEGEYDPQIRSIAKLIGSFSPETIYMRLAIEPNLAPKYVFWGELPTLYQKIWSHVWSVFQDSGATNTHWVFSPNYRPRPEWFFMYHPQEIAQTVGVDIYNFEQMANKIPSEDQDPFPNLAPATYHLRSLAPSAPFWITEFGAALPKSYGKDAPQKRDAWLSDLLWDALSFGATHVNCFQINKQEVGRGYIEWSFDDARDFPKLRNVLNSGAFLRNEAKLPDIHATIQRAL